MGMAFLPIFCDAQQDEPNRVSVLVVARELGRTVEIIQLPATNLPLMARTKPQKFRSTSTFTNNVEYSSASGATVKEPTVPNVKIKPSNKANVATLSKTETTNQTKIFGTSVDNPAIGQNNRPIEVALKSAAITTNKLAKKKVVTKENVVVLPPAENKLVQKPTTNVVVKNNIEKVQKPVEEVLSAEQLQAAYAAKVNAVNYIWIGFFLMLAGVVLGLLFGKPAFLVSFAGLIFVILGVLM